MLNAPSSAVNPPVVVARSYSRRGSVTSRRRHRGETCRGIAISANRRASSNCTATRANGRAAHRGCTAWASCGCACGDSATRPDRCSARCGSAARAFHAFHSGNATARANADSLADRISTWAGNGDARSLPPARSSGRACIHIERTACAFRRHAIVGS